MGKIGLDNQNNPREYGVVIEQDKTRRGNPAATSSGAFMDLFSFDSFSVHHVGQLRADQAQAAFEAAFALVTPAGHWKDAIDAAVDLNDAATVEAIQLGELALGRSFLPGEVVCFLNQAIAHFTGTLGSWSSRGPRVLTVTAPGYYAGPCN